MQQPEKLDEFASAFKNSEDSKTFLIATNEKYSNQIQVLEQAISAVNNTLEYLNGWRAFQWVWKRKILCVKHNTYVLFLSEKKLLVLHAELQEQKARAKLKEVQQTLDN